MFFLTPRGVDFLNFYKFSQAKAVQKLKANYWIGNLLLAEMILIILIY